MDKQQRTIIRGMAATQIQQLEMLVKAIDTAEEFHTQLMSANTLVNQYASEMGAAQARIKEDEATIQFKDNQLSAAHKKVQLMEEENDRLNEENDRKRDSLKTYEDVITTLKKELKAYQDNEPLPVLDLRPAPAGEELE